VALAAVLSNIPRGDRLGRRRPLDRGLQGRQTGHLTSEPWRGHSAIMATARRENELEVELAAMLTPSFEGIEVEVGHAERWDRVCVAFRWPGFEDLLPEERFHRLSRVIPTEFRDERMRGFVWLELAPEESIEEYLRLPRSEDVAGREKSICTGLVENRFFESLRDSLAPKPTDRCPGDFSLSLAALSAAGFSATKIRDAKLVFIRHGAFCDCQVIETVHPVVRQLLAGAA